MRYALTREDWLTWAGGLALAAVVVLLYFTLRHIVHLWYAPL